MKLTPEKKQQFIEWLKSIGLNVDAFKCPVCTGNDFAILDNIVFLPTGTESAYPNVGLICTTCKNTSLFDATDSGVMIEEKSDPSAIVCQECFEREATMQNDCNDYVCSECYNK